MARYVLKKFDGSIQPNLIWNKKSHAEAWIQHHFKLYGGLDWRIGGKFKARRDNEMEIVTSSKHTSVKWENVIPAPFDEYDPTI